MRTRVLTGLLLIMLAGCKSRNAVSHGVLPPKKMQAVLWDMLRADQFLADFVLNRDTTKNNKTETLKLYQQVFAIHKIDKETFQQSFSYYRDHPALFNAILDSIGLQPVEPLPGLANPDTPVVAPVLDTGKKNPGIEMTDTIKPKRAPRKEPVN